MTPLAVLAAKDNMVDKKLKERFEAKFIPVTESGCWLWEATAHSRGYGLIHTGRKLTKAHMEFAHRFSYELYKGHRPSREEEVCHKCDVPSCVNPDHLFLGSHADNMLDMAKKNRCGKRWTERLTEEVVVQILTYPANQAVTAEIFGIDSGYCSRLRNFKVKKWAYLKDKLEG